MVRKPVNSSNAAISTVQAPDNCSSIVATTASGNLSRYGPTTLSRYAFAEASGLILLANKFSTLGTAFGVLVNSIPNTSCRLEAGSVLISNTLFPLSAKATAVAQAVDVFPTPPLPVKNKNFVPI